MNDHDGWTQVTIAWIFVGILIVVGLVLGSFGSIIP